MTIQPTRIVMGGEGPENASAMEYLESLAAVAAATSGAAARDYGIWTSLPEPSSHVRSADGVKASSAVGRKQKAA
jgi:hypothetical protein